MELDVENWARENMEDVAFPLFEEAVKCYKIGAYQSAYLMSYLAFKISIRYRIIDSDSRPDHYNEDEWQKEIKVELENDDWWEKNLNNIVESNPDKKKKEWNSLNEREKKEYEKTEKLAAIFNFKNRASAINKYIYFKDIRNSCAHAKSEIINAATVEQFWNYLQDNLSSFYVLGGQDYLISEIFNAYKYKDTNHYFEKINQLLVQVSIVFKTRCFECFESAFKNVHIELEEKDKEFWRKFICSKSENIQEGFIRFLMKDIHLFVSFFNYFPEILTKAYSIDEKFIHDKINGYLKSSPSYNIENQKTYWNLLLGCLINCRELMKLGEIFSEYSHGFPDTIFNEQEIKTFHDNKVFNKILLNQKYGAFFEVGRRDIASNGHLNGEEFVKLFKYAYMNKELIGKLSYAINRLEDRIKNENYIDWERIRSRFFKQAVEENIPNIINVVERENIPICDKMKEYLNLSLSVGRY